MIDSTVLRRVRAEVSLVDLAREHGLDLRRKGTDWWACCPFHTERSGSFKVSERHNSYKCFGCGAAGDVIAFFMATRQLDSRRGFPEAVRQLAGRAAISCDETQGNSSRKFRSPRRTREEIEAEQNRKRDLALAHRAHHALNEIITQWSWPAKKIRSGSACSTATPYLQAVAILSLFHQDDVVWCGEVKHSIHKDEIASADLQWRQEVGRHFRSAGDWVAGGEMPGSRICAALFPKGAVFSRSQEIVTCARFLVIEHDSVSIDAQGAMLRWLREKVGLRLRAVVFTGNKSLHGWFDYPAAPRDVARLKTILCGVQVEEDGRRRWEGGLGFDPAIWNPVQPWRLPGWKHDKSNRLAELWWYEGGAQ